MKNVYVIAYDIICDKKRRKVADILLDYGHRMQKSVFECALDSKELQELTQKLSAVIDSKQDSILFYMLCKACLKQHRFLGLEPIRPEKGFDIL